ncbi:MAG: xylulokinase [Clostridia bacterium]|nr:xylulokinase [Clostridia bacterium]
MMYIGIDLGTSSVKMILCDSMGKIINSVNREYPISFPKEGYSEQNPEDWYNETIEGLKALTEGYGDKIKGLSIAGQMHGLVMLDENDELLRECILWNDSRSSKECDYLNCEIGVKKLTEWTANIAFPGFTAPKILWVKNNERDIFDRCKKIMLPKDYLVYRLTGEFVTEPSDASGLLLFDVKNKCYSKEMLELCSITEDMLPKVHESYDKIGTVKKELCELFGWGKVIVAPGAGDNAAAAVGMGVTGGNMCSISLGTSGTVFITSDKFTVDEKNALHSFAHADGGYHLMGCILSAASCNKWFLEDILNSKDYSECEKGIADGENNVIFLPYLMGERSPHNDPYARGAFVGMSMDTERGDMIKAVMEGVCYALRDSVEVARGQGIVIDEVRVCGGGAKSSLWCKILANVLRVKVLKTNCQEGPSFGACILASVASGEYESVKAATDNTVKVVSELMYDEEAAKKYDKGYEKFTLLYKSLKDWYRYEK